MSDCTGDIGTLDNNERCKDVQYIFLYKDTHTLVCFHVCIIVPFNF